ncbi:MAG: NAD(P)-dependent oxidoreductase [Phycisphaeraceae bacterium]
MHDAKRLIVVHPRFTRVWPLAADELERCWREDAAGDVHRLNAADDRPLGELVAEANAYAQVAALGTRVTPACLDALPALREIAVVKAYGTADEVDPALAAALEARGVELRHHTGEAFWGQSVAEFGLALTLAALRRIPQTYARMMHDHDAWDYEPGSAHDVAGQRGHQYGDDPRFTSGTLFGKRVRIVGMGNIAGRYAKWCAMMGADVAAWDPFAPEVTFELAGARRVASLDALVDTADIFAPVLPLTPETRGLVTADHIAALPAGCLVVCVTRMHIVDADALMRSVLADELALAADVFAQEPVPLDSPLLGRANVVHTPHNAGRTRHANEQWARLLARQFSPIGANPRGHAPPTQAASQA